MRVFSTLRGWLVVCPVAIFAGSGCVGIADEEQVQSDAQASIGCPPTHPSIDIRRSVAIVDLPTLAATTESGKPIFALRRVLNAILASGDTRPGASSAAELYRKIFDTNNAKAQSFVAGGQHCDDHKNQQGVPVLNGFPIDGPRQEGALADLSQHDPFCSGPGCDPYSPIAITNRFDLAPPGGQTCGQYRIVFGKGTGGQTPVELAGNKSAFDRNLMIFETVLPNPHPHSGLAGCAPVVAFWVGLSAMNDPVARGRALGEFFFQGIPGFEAALTFNHLTGYVNPQTRVQMSGQIRTNQFMFGVGFQPWQLREYNLARTCPGNNKACVASVKMVSPKLNPAASLFADCDSTPMGVTFRSPYTPRGFLSQVPALADSDINLLNMNELDPKYNGGQSTSSPAFAVPQANDTNYNVLFDPAGAFASSIQSKLTSIGSSLTPTEIVRRAQTQSCAGCHQLSTSTAFAPPPFGLGGVANANQIGDGLEWPDAAISGPATGFIPSFTHTSEVNLQPIDPGSSVVCDAACTADPATCHCEWVISDAMTSVFLPFRRDNMASFLAGHPSGNGGIPH